MDISPCRHVLLRTVTGPCKPHALRPALTSRTRLPRSQAAFSADALESLKHARNEASRQGSMFAGCDHLLLGITNASNSTAAKLLRDHGLDLSSMRDTLDATRVMPSSSYMQASDVDFAPDARSALNAAVAASTASGLYVACTPHILIGVLAHASPGFKALLQASIQEPEQLLKEAQELAATTSNSSSSSSSTSVGGEAVGRQPPSAQAQVEQLVKDYKHHQASPLSATDQGLAAAASSFTPSKLPSAGKQQAHKQQPGDQQEKGLAGGKGPEVDPPWVMTPEDDEIYN